MGKPVRTTAQSEDTQILSQYQYSQVANHQQIHVPLNDLLCPTNSNHRDHSALSSRDAPPMQSQYDHDKSTVQELYLDLVDRWMQKTSQDLPVHHRRQVYHHVA